MSSAVHIDNAIKEILILSEEPTQGLDDTTLAAEAKYPIIFRQPKKKKETCMSLHYNKSNSFLFVNATKTYQFKSKDSETKDHILCLGNISNNLTINDM